MINFNATEILRFYHLANLSCKCLFTPILGKFLGHSFPQMASPVIYFYPPKHPLARKHVVWGIKRVRQSRGLTLERIEKKIRTTKSHKSVISRIRGEPPPAKPICSRVCMCGDVLDAIMCAKFLNKIWRGCDTTGGRNFDFPIDFWMAITTMHCAACDYIYFSW